MAIESEIALAVKSVLAEMLRRIMFFYRLERYCEPGEVVIAQDTALTFHVASVCTISFDPGKSVFSMSRNLPFCELVGWHSQPAADGQPEVLLILVHTLQGMVHIRIDKLERDLLQPDRDFLRSAFGRAHSSTRVLRTGLGHRAI